MRAALGCGYDSRRLAPRLRESCAETLPDVREANRQKRADVSALRQVVYHGRGSVLCRAARVAARGVFLQAVTRRIFSQSRAGDFTEPSRSSNPIPWLALWPLRPSSGLCDDGSGSGGGVVGDEPDADTGADSEELAADLAALKRGAEDV